MSSKSLPEHCSKSGMVYCAWQFPNASTSSATDSKSYAARWATKPGFLDPFHVAYLCVRRLKAATFVNIAYNARNKKADKSRLCPGLQIYLGRLVTDNQVSKDVMDHIKNGSAENVSAIIRNYRCLEQVLLFLLKYLKERGPIVKFKYNSREMLRNVVLNPRYLVPTFMTTLCEFELEFHSTVVIGDYLNFLLFVAFAHDLYWIKELLAEIWGPLLVDFVNVGTANNEAMKENEKRDNIKAVTLQMLENIPWERLKSVENLKITINPQINDSYMKRKTAEAATEMSRLTIKPLSQMTLLSGDSQNDRGSILNILGDLENMSTPTAEASNVDDATAIAEMEAAQLEKKRLEEEAAKRAEAIHENQDFSDRYGYSKKFLEKYAPHGMCKPGWDAAMKN